MAARRPREERPRKERGDEEQHDLDITERHWVALLGLLSLFSFLLGVDSVLTPQRGRWRDPHHLMSKHVTISSSEAGDRLAIRELIEAYAHCADRRDLEG